MMLEENGFSRYSSAKYPRPSMLNNVVRSNQTRKLGAYVIFDQSHAGEISMLLDVINAPENSHGEVVKVIIGTKRIEQGVSFKNVRQIHIMTPWWNMNRNKQIIGRGSRNLSHQALPLNERNVTVFYHVGKNKKGYSPDIGMYEKALEKQDTINAVEQILRKNSVDCLMNVALNQYTGTTRTIPSARKILFFRSPTAIRVNALCREIPAGIEKFAPGLRNSRLGLKSSRRHWRGSRRD